MINTAAMRADHVGDYMEPDDVRADVLALCDEIDRLRTANRVRTEQALVHLEGKLKAEAKLAAIEALCHRPGFRGPLTHVSVEDLREALGFQP